MSKQDDYRELQFLRAARKRKQLRKLGGLYLTEAAAEEYRRELCAGCGRRKYDVIQYFGETFCRGCVEKWRNGKR